MPDLKDVKKNIERLENENSKLEKDIKILESILFKIQVSQQKRADDKKLDEYEKLLETDN